MPIIVLVPESGRRAGSVEGCDKLLLNPVGRRKYRVDRYKIVEMRTVEYTCEASSAMADITC